MHFLCCFNKVREVMLQHSAHVSTVNPAVFFWPNENGSVNRVLVCHVNDFILGGNRDFETSVTPNIRSAFNVGGEE